MTETPLPLSELPWGTILSTVAIVLGAMALAFWIGRRWERLGR